jgi:hypothetical protein
MPWRVKQSVGERNIESRKGVGNYVYFVGNKLNLMEEKIFLLLFGN